jgi:sugar/nucleoside kinase (ribokinase family)
LRCGVLAAVGADTGDWIASSLNNCGVDTGEFQFDPIEPTGMTVVASRSEDRAFLTYPGANRRFPELFLARFASSIPRARHIHLAFPPPLDTAASIADKIHAQGATLSLDVGWHQDWLCDSRALPLLRSVDIFFPNLLEARHMTGEQDATAILRHFAAAGLQHVALKLGAQGAALLWEGATWFADPYPVELVDTTGAGDCFDAGFLDAWLTRESPARCLRQANICGALSTEAHGGIAGFPDRERLITELEKTRS